ncbi:putative monocarboxylate transporter 4 [Apostichopus japonicus]|uniref:Putative monocarboxylate transporter 4 n=1 Tax=Stichopus japonicus TaxID=307972 RepID=A0A2G8LDW0_STIJA|nr:putative monocarboxylate transporter 4 [Apostichopus japonicus]
MDGIGFGSAWTSSIVILRNAFSDDATFGIIQTLTDQSSFIGMMILPVLFERLQELYGTRGALLLFGALNLHIIVASITLRPERGQQVLQEDRHNSDAALSKVMPLISVHWKVFVSNLSVPFLMIIACLFTFNLVGWALFAVTLGIEKGLSKSQAVFLSSFAGVGAIFGRLWCILLYYLKITTPFHFICIPALLECITFIILMLPDDNYVMLLTVSFVVGITFGLIGAAMGGLCSMKVPVEDFNPAVVLFFISVAMGNATGGGLSDARFGALVNIGGLIMHCICPLNFFIEGAEPPPAPPRPQAPPPGSAATGAAPTRGGAPLR